MARGTAGRVLQIAEQHRTALLRMEGRATSQMARAYGGIWRRVRSDLDDLMTEYEQIPEDDAPGMLNWLRKQQRLETLLRDTEDQVGQFAGVADERIQQGQRAAIEASQRAAASMVRAQTTGLDVTWNRLPTEMIETLVGTTATGSPLRELLDKLGPEASEAVRQGLIEGTAMGDNPREVARAVRKQLGGNLGRALTISRTEMLRAAREATRQSYLQNSDVVGQWKWLCAKQGRTCAMCLAMDGTLHDLDETLDDHPNGRCTSVPVVKGAPEVQWQDGKSWLASQDEAVQQQVLGRAGAAAYQAGAVNLSDFVGQRTSADWGTTRYAKSLTGILGAEKAAEYKDLTKYGQNSTDSLSTVFGDFDRANVPDLPGTIHAAEIAQQAGISEKFAGGMIDQWKVSTNGSDLPSLSIHRDAVKELGAELSPFQRKLVNEAEARRRGLATDHFFYRGNDNPSEQEIADFLAKRDARTQVYEAKPGGRAYEKQFDALTPPNSEHQRSALRVMYDKTQQDLSAAGIDPDSYVTLYRGMKAPVSPGQSVSVRGNALESWSISKNVAADFAKNYNTGAGMREGNEVVLTARVKARDIFSITTNGIGIRGEGEVIILGHKRSVLIESASGISSSQRLNEMLEGE